MFKKTWVEFCHTTSIHGLHYIFVGHERRHKRKHQFIWSLIWLLMLALAMVNCGNNVWLYLQYDIKTVATYKNMNELPFPAITLCNINTARKSVVAFNEIALYIVSITTSNRNNETEALAEGNRTCYVQKSVETKNLLELKAQYDSWKNIGITEGMQRLATNSFTSTVKCWWNDAIVDCKGLFLNHPDTRGSCFTFNINESSVNAVKNSDGSLPLSFGYGLNTTKYVAKKQLSSGPNYGLRLLMNVNQSESCGVFQKWAGAGFRSYIHDSRESSSYFVNKPLFIRPGLDLSVSIRPISFHRQTEHLGKCVSNVDLYMNLVPGFYSQISCMIQCASEFLFFKCKCFPPYDDYLQYKAAIALNIPLENFKICKSWESLKCIKSYEPLLQRVNFESFCPRCKRQCHENKYDYSVSFLKFPTSSNRSRLNITNYIAKKEEAKNFALVNFYFDNMNLLVVDESQKILLDDVFIYFGGVIGLFLGMSFLSLFEVADQLIYSVSFWIDRLKLKRQDKIKRMAKTSRVLEPKREANMSTMTRLSLAVVDDVFYKYRTRRSNVDSRSKPKNSNPIVTKSKNRNAMLITKR